MVAEGDVDIGRVLTEGVESVSVRKEGVEIFGPDKTWTLKKGSLCCCIFSSFLLFKLVSKITYFLEQIWSPLFLIYLTRSTFSRPMWIRGLTKEIWNDMPLPTPRTQPGCSTLLYETEKRSFLLLGINEPWLICCAY